MATITERIMGYFGYRKTRARRSYGYDAAAVNRLTSDWVKLPLSADAALRTTLRTMRARSRDLAINNDYAKKFLHMVVTNVVGPGGMLLKNKAVDFSGSLDQQANRKIETAWSDWGKKANASVTARQSWLDLQTLFVRTLARDGEVLIRKVRGFANPYRFALQALEADHLDELLNYPVGGGGAYAGSGFLPITLTAGHTIRMGVELDAWRRPVAYWLLKNHPYDYPYVAPQQKWERIPADEIIHAYIQERPEQTRGAPWMYSAMVRLKMLGGYEEAETIAARIGACKMGFYVTPTGEEYVGDERDDQGNVLDEAEPGIFNQLPQGMDFKEFKPEHPAGNFEPFVKALLRGISSGLNVSYNSLASDLRDVNYSSIRSGLLEERDHWRMLQQFVAEMFHDDVFAAWLDMALLTGVVTLPAAKFDKFNAPSWQARGWAWVDPKHDVESNIASIRSGLKTRHQVVAEQGQDLEETYIQLAEEEKLAQKYGLMFDLANVTGSAGSSGGTTDAGQAAL